MSEISMYEAQKKKMQGLCDEHDLVYLSLIHIFGNIVILKEGFTTPGERDFIGLDEDDVKFLGAMAVSLSGGGIKWESEAR